VDADLIRARLLKAFGECDIPDAMLAAMEPVAQGDREIRFAIARVYDIAESEVLPEMLPVLPSDAEAEYSE
jgi:hypothetical protein